MSTKGKWRNTFQKTRSTSQASLDLNKASVNSLLDESDEVSDDELQKYLGTLKEKSGVNRLWMGNTFGKVIDRTPNVSISSISDGELVSNADEQDNEANDADFLPNLLQLPDDNAGSEAVSETSSVKPLEAVNMISGDELSSDGPVQFNNLKFSISDKEAGDIVGSEDVKSITNDLSFVEEVQTLDEVSEVVEELGTERAGSHSSNEDTQRSKSSKSRGQHSNKSLTEHGTSSIMSASSSKQTTSRRKSRDDQSSRTRKRRANSRRKSHRTESRSSKSEYSYSTDFSGNDDEKRTDLSSSYSKTDSSYSETVTRSASKRSSKPKYNYRNNSSHHDVGVQVNMAEGVKDRRPNDNVIPGLDPMLGGHNLDPTPIMPHLVADEVVQALTTYNPAILALTDMIRQQLRLVEQFVDNSKRMYESYTSNLNDTYRYTTLEDTIQYMHENGPRNFHRKSTKREQK